ncbi:transcriptional regulator ATRX isoform X1 [Strongylocentrotus purpuratus]|uniref:PHD-type domain-containing protein n=2 Tax=Strongylocentrotus purpuratus TaxID=7668 RepID=A0A7M7SWH7_STRPU|nr:transcriptional regulator ATRX isoform X1 [Strongylocentrotus purpuratus]
MPKARRAYSCTQCFYISERSHDLKRHFSTCHGEGQSHDRESLPERTAPIRPALQSIITPVPGSAEKEKGQQKAMRKPMSSDSNSSESLPNTFINQPSHSCTTFDKPKKEKTRIGPTPKGDSKKKKFVRFNVNSNGLSESAGIGSKTAMCALTGVNITSVYQLKKKKEPNAVDSSLNVEIPEGISDSYIMPKARKRHSCTHCFYTTKCSHDLKRHLFRRHGEGQSHGRESSPERTAPIRTAIRSNVTPVPGSAEKEKGQQKAMRKPGVASHSVSSDSGLSESVQDIFINQPSHSRTPIDKPKKEKTGTGPISGTVIVPPEAAPDGEQDGYKSKELRKQSPRKRKDSNNKNAPPTVKSVLCTVCGIIVNLFDRKSFFRHPVLSVVICKGCFEFYNKSLWKTDEDGIEEECAWCGQGGSLSCCDFCCKTFCKDCIAFNLGTDELKRILKKKWRCYVCDPRPLKVFVDDFSALLAQSLEIEQKETEKANVSVQKKGVKAPNKKEKMQDATIAEEFLQYLVGNNSNRAQFMRSLVRLKKEVPDMQNLQMNLSLKHIGEVKSALEEFEACVKRQLHGDAHKSDSALDGINQVDCERPEEKSKSQMEETQVKTQEKEELAGIDEAKEESAMETAEGDGVDNNTKPRKKKKCEPEKMELNGTAKWGEGPGEDSSNPEEESGFDGIPGESSSGSSWDEGGEKEDKVGKVKDLSAVTVTRSSRHSFAASESDSSGSKYVNSDDNYTKPRRRRLSRKKKKCEPEQMDSASEEDMKLKRHEGIRGLKRKCNRATDSDDASENVPDAQDKPEEGETESVAKRGEEKSDVEKESESEGNPSKKAKKVRKSPAKIDLKSRELLSSDSSSDDESNAESDGCYGVSWKSLNEEWDSREVAENLLMDELDCSDEEDNDDDDDKGDEDEEVGGARSKRSKKKAVKKAEEDEEWNDGERQIGTGGGGGSRDGKNGGDDKKKKTKRKDPTWDLYKKKWKAQKKAKEDEEWNDGERQIGTGGGGSRDGKNGGDDKKKKTKRKDPTWDLYKKKWKAQKKAKEDVEFIKSERQIGTGGGGSRDGMNGGDDKKKKGKGQDESTKKSRSLLVISPFSEDEEDEETSK